VEQAKTHRHPRTHTGVVSACKPLTALFARGRRGNVGKVAGKIGRWHLDCIMEGRCLNAAPVSCKWHVETIELWFVSGAEEGRIWCAPCPWSTLSKWQDLPVAGSQAVCRSTSFHCFWPLSGAHVWPTPMSFSSLHSTPLNSELAKKVMANAQVSPVYTARNIASELF